MKSISIFRTKKKQQQFFNNVALIRIKEKLQSLEFIIYLNHLFFIKC